MHNIVTLFLFICIIIYWILSYFLLFDYNCLKYTLLGSSIPLPLLFIYLEQKNMFKNLLSRRNPLLTTIYTFNRNNLNILLLYFYIIKRIVVWNITYLSLPYSNYSLTKRIINRSWKWDKISNVLRCNHIIWALRSSYVWESKFKFNH